MVIYFFFQEKMDSMFRKGESPDSWIPVDVSFIKAKSLTSAIFRKKGKLENIWLFGLNKPTNPRKKSPNVVSDHNIAWIESDRDPLRVSAEVKWYRD